MNKAKLFSFLLLLGSQALAQPGATKKKPVTLLKTLNDSASYVIGFSIGSSSKMVGLPTLDTGIVVSAFRDGMQGKYSFMDERSTYYFLNRLGEKYYRLPGRDSSSINNEVPSREYLDSASYAMGVDRATFMRQQGIVNLDLPILKRGLFDAISNRQALIPEKQSTSVMNRLHTRMQLQKVQPNIDAGRKFLAANRKKPGVKTTASGLQYEIIEKGKGIRPTERDTFVAHYRGTLLDGTEFDASYNRGTPLTLGMTQVIKGWTEGLKLMPAGSTFRFYIPYQLGYGVFDNPPIPGGSTLIFEIKLLEVKKKNKDRTTR